MSVEKDSSSSRTPANRNNAQEQDDSLSSSEKRHRVRHDPVPTKKRRAEGKPKTPLSSKERHAKDCFQPEELANRLAALDAELPPCDTTRPHVRVLSDAIGYIRLLKSLKRAVVMRKEVINKGEERMKAPFEQLD